MIMHYILEVLRVVFDSTDLDKVLLPVKGLQPSVEWQSYYLCYGCIAE